MKYLAVALVLGGCGRLGFEGRDGDGTSGRPSDGATGAALGRCGEPRPVADPLTIAGTTFEYTNFTNGVMPTPNVQIAVISGTTTLASTTSDASGAYTLAVPTQGMAVDARLVYAPPGYYTSTFWLDGPLDRDLLGSPSPYAWPGDAPVWSAGAMGAVYSGAGVAQDTTAGTINIQVVDCAKRPVDGVTVTITPAPGVMEYLGADGKPSAALTATTPPYDVAFAANAQPGPTQITLSGGGLAWPTFDIQVEGGMNNTLVLARGIP